jgi:hypothetical protein
VPVTIISGWLDSVAGMRRALRLAEAAIRLYIQGLMALLDDEGVHAKLGPEHFVHYRLLMEILSLPDGSVIEKQEITRSHLPTLGEKFGKWINRYRRGKIQ